MRVKRFSVSTWLGLIGLLLLLAGQQLASGEMPHDLAGWLKFAGGVIGSGAAIMLREHPNAPRLPPDPQQCPPAGPNAP